MGGFLHPSQPPRVLFLSCALRVCCRSSLDKYGCVVFDVRECFLPGISSYSSCHRAELRLSVKTFWTHHSCRDLVPNFYGHFQFLCSHCPARLWTCFQQCRSYFYNVFN